MKKGLLLYLISQLLLSCSPEEYNKRVTGQAYFEGSGATGALKGRPVDVLRSGNVDN